MKNISTKIVCIFILLLVMQGCDFHGDTPETIPKIPTGVTALQATGGILVSWNRVSGAKKYRVIYGSSEDVISTDGGETTTTSLLVSGLTPDLTYYFIVQAGNGAGWGASSEVKQAVAPGIAGSVTGVSVSPASVTVAAGGSRQFTAVVSGTGNPSQSVSWSLEGGGSGTTISQSGLLTVQASATSGSVTVRARSTQDSTKSGTAFVTITASGSGDIPSPAYKIGDTGPSGGLVFYVKSNNNDGWRYLETAPASTEQTVMWGYNNTVGGTAFGIGAGKKNTEDIMKYQIRTGELCMAAFTCDELSAGGYNDWFLPSRDELMLMYTNLKSKGLGGFGNGYYWSSSESNSYYAYCQRFNDGSQTYNSKSSSYAVRAVRAF